MSLERFGKFEVAIRAGAARMDDALGDALVIEVEDLLAKGEVLERASARARPRAANSGCPR